MVWLVDNHVPKECGKGFDLQAKFVCMEEYLLRDVNPLSES